MLVVTTTILMVLAEVRLIYPEEAADRHGLCLPSQSVPKASQPAYGLSSIAQPIKGVR